jgi:cardiolipin synthase
MMLSFNKKDWVTIPNILSLVRLLLIPIFSFIYLTATQPVHYYLAAFIILFSGLTDLVDGWVARKYHQITELGKLLDPIADKLTQVVVLFCLITQFKWMRYIVLLFLVKESFMLINSLILLKKGKKLDGAKWYGKIATAIFYICVVFLVAFPLTTDSIASVFILIIGFFLLLSLFLYGKIFKDMYQE